MVIGFVGKMGTGKTTVCLHMQQMYKDIVRINMKDGLKNEMMDRLHDTILEIAKLLNIQGTDENIRSSF